MAGLGAKLFTSFSKLTAAQVNGYLADQTIMRFASAAARDAAFGGVGEPTLAEGMHCYLDDTNQLLFYNGTSWIIPNSPAQNPTGLELVTTATCTAGGTAVDGVVTIGAGVSAVTVANAFSSTYENYKIILSGGLGGTAQAMAFQFGPSSVTGYNTNYNYVLDIKLYSAGTSTILFSNSSTRWDYIGESSTSISQINVDVLAPNLPKWSIYSGGYTGINNTGTTGGVHKVEAAFTDFTINVANVLTGGTIRVYGYRKS